jgi:hypothetical protein
MKNTKEIHEIDWEAEQLTTAPSLMIRRYDLFWMDWRADEIHIREQNTKIKLLPSFWRDQVWDQVWVHVWNQCDRIQI